MTVRFALLGAGRIGKAHARAVSANPDATLVAVTDALPEAAEAASAAGIAEGVEVDPERAAPAIGVEDDLEVPAAAVAAEAAGIAQDDDIEGSDADGGEGVQHHVVAGNAEGEFPQIGLAGGDVEVRAELLLADLAGADLHLGVRAIGDHAPVDARAHIGGVRICLLYTSPSPRDP